MKPATGRKWCWEDNAWLPHIDQTWPYRLELQQNNLKNDRQDAGTIDRKILN